MPHIELNGIKYGIGGAGGGGGEPVYTLGLGTEIPAGANLDSYITPGVYWNSDIQSIENRPPLGTEPYGFTLVVSEANDGYAVQEIRITLSEWSFSPSAIRYQRRYKKSNSTFSAWVAIGGINSIVAEDDSGIWHWRKWDNGVAECWARYSITSYNNSSVLSTNRTLPFVFTDCKPIASVIGESNSSLETSVSVKVRWFPNTDTSVPNSVSCYAQSSIGGFSSGVSVKADVYVVGTWK